MQRALWINDQLAHADQAYQDGDFYISIRALQRIVERYPNSPDSEMAEELIQQIREAARGLIP